MPMRFLLLASACVFVLSAPALAGTQETPPPPAHHEETAAPQKTPEAAKQETPSSEKTATEETTAKKTNAEEKPKIADTPSDAQNAAAVEPASASAQEQKSEEKPMQNEHPHWGYTGTGSASNWGSLDETYHACKDGMKQSPVNINKFMQGQMPPLEISYKASPLAVANNGHTIQVNMEPGSTLSLDGKTYTLAQFHFHTPSEHYLDGAPYPMEAHFVHKAEDGSLAVIGVMMKLGAHNPVIEGIWQNAPTTEGAKATDMVQVTASDLMPEDRGYYSYEGSLTTPPCSEGVRWIVLKNPIELSEKQLGAFQALFPVNARPVQPLGERMVRGD